MESVGGDGGRFKKGGELFGVGLDKVEEETDTGGKETVKDDIVGGGLHER